MNLSIVSNKIIEQKLFLCRHSLGCLCHKLIPQTIKSIFIINLSKLACKKINGKRTIINTSLLGPSLQTCGPKKVGYLDELASDTAKDGLEDQTASRKGANNLYRSLVIPNN